MIAYQEPPESSIRDSEATTQISKQRFLKVEGDPTYQIHSVITLDAGPCGNENTFSGRNPTISFFKIMKS